MAVPFLEPWTTNEKVPKGGTVRDDLRNAAVEVGRIPSGVVAAWKNV